ncbi:hypothetical protein [Mycobacterium talmoniae]|uniref:Secreted protein n=1 Tax=Mycobacterium talmoniae TaxID=1858794 RepID=A0A1S1NHL0_9MYCO|nr:MULTISPECIES: hypothetical protein [Mycobacterium]OHU98177.1 hypothetical protein BKN37_21155 [Mycobacterium talmoniae]PQM49425.1 hypothetical protein C1Y40_00354 [Mycobacterium talmoniae]TDH56288.1 hypothetical protein E2F47_07415 [Mycobacterium eburneum]
MRLTVCCCIAAGVALAGAGVIAATPVNPALPDVEVPAIQLSAGSSQDMDQEFLNLLQLLGPDADNLVSGTVDLPDPVDIGGTGVDGLDPDSLMPNLTDPGEFSIPPTLWHEVFRQSG